MTQFPGEDQLQLGDRVREPVVCIRETKPDYFPTLWEVPIFIIKSPDTASSCQGVGTVSSQTFRAHNS